MKHYYKDILDRINEPPKWFDENGTPRFDDFTPDQVATVGANEVAYIEILCQACAHPFNVVMVATTKERLIYQKIYDEPMPSLAQKILDKSLRYGDPPNIECCPIGITMQSDVIRVLGYWERQRGKWVENRTLIIPITDTIACKHCDKQVCTRDSFNCATCGHDSLCEDCYWNRQQFVHEVTQ